MTKSNEKKKEFKNYGAFEYEWPTIRIIGRFSKGSEEKPSREYYQTSFDDGIAETFDGEPTNFVPVFLKKGVEKLNFDAVEVKLDKANQAYKLYTLNAKNVFIPLNEKGKVTKVIVMK